MVCFLGYRVKKPPDSISKNGIPTSDLITNVGINTYSVTICMLYCLKIALSTFDSTSNS
jgi:hypothetical protein